MAASSHRLIPETKVTGFGGLPVFLMGISMGGCVAMNVMRQHVRSQPSSRTHDACFRCLHALALAHDARTISHRCSQGEMPPLQTCRRSCSKARCCWRPWCRWRRFHRPASTRTCCESQNPCGNCCSVDFGTFGTTARCVRLSKLLLPLLRPSAAGCADLPLPMLAPVLWPWPAAEAPLVSCRPLSRLVSWLLPAAQVAKVHRNPLYPELQQEWDDDPLNFQGNTRARSAAGALLSSAREDDPEPRQLTEAETTRASCTPCVRVALILKDLVCRAEYLRVTRQMLPCLNEFTFPWICFHGEGRFRLCLYGGNWLRLTCVRALIHATIHASACNI